MLIGKPIDQTEMLRANYSSSVPTQPDTPSRLNPRLRIPRLRLQAAGGMGFHVVKWAKGSHVGQHVPAVSRAYNPRT